MSPCTACGTQRAHCDETQTGYGIRCCQACEHEESTR